MLDLLTTGQESKYLWLGERKLYELVADGAITCTKVTGKWLFHGVKLPRWPSGNQAPAHKCCSKPC